jgi:hypothetical protein
MGYSPFPLAILGPLTPQPINPSTSLHDPSKTPQSNINHQINLVLSLGGPQAKHTDQRAHISIIRRIKVATHMYTHKGRRGKSPHQRGVAPHVIGCQLTPLWSADHPLAPSTSMHAPMQRNTSLHHLHHQIKVGLIQGLWRCIIWIHGPTLKNYKYPLPPHSHSCLQRRNYSLSSFQALVVCN